MRHTYACPLRWADLDLLGHVNNVSFVDYLQEARAAMFADHAPVQRDDELSEGVVVVDHRVEYAAPLVYRSEPVLVDTWVSEVRGASFTLAHEVYDAPSAGAGDEGERRVYLRAWTRLTPYVFGTGRPRRLSPAEVEVLERFAEGPVPPAPLPVDRTGPPPLEAQAVFPVQVRFSDVDVFRHVNNVTYFEYLQEARIALIEDLRGPGDDDWSAHVVARTDVSYRRAILPRREPYAVHTWVSRVGRRSFTLDAEIRDGEEVLATSRVVVVGFDMATQRSADLAASERERLLQALAG